MTTLRLGLVLRTTEQLCTIVTGGRAEVVGYAPPFPAPRVERVAPGHLVAIATTAGGTDLVVWRWFDAVVQETTAAGVVLWEPAHGEVVGRPRDTGRGYLPGTRAYLSAGLPGAAWWVAGPAVGRAEDADVELDAVAAFLAEVGFGDPRA